jgi:hypothetical protein
MQFARRVCQRNKLKNEFDKTQTPQTFAGFFCASSGMDATGNVLLRSLNLLNANKKKTANSQQNA